MKNKKWKVSEVGEKEKRTYNTKKMKLKRKKTQWYSLLGWTVFCALVIYVPTVINNDTVRANLKKYSQNDISIALAMENASEANFESEKGKYCVELTPEQQIIKEVADMREFKDIELLFCLAKHESNYDRYAVGVNVHKQSNGTILTTRDLGIFQWNHYYHPDISKECKFDIACATNEVISKINQEGGCDSWTTCKYCK